MKHLAAFLMVVTAALSARAVDFPDMMNEWTGKTDTDLVSLSFAPDTPGTDKILGTKLIYHGMEIEEGREAFFLYIYHFIPKYHEISVEWKEWRDRKTTTPAMQDIVKRRVPKDCQKESDDKKKSGCWLKALLKAKKIEPVLGHFLIKENGKKVYEETPAEVAF